MTGEISAPFDPKDIHDRLKDMNRYNPENQVRNNKLSDAVVNNFKPILEEYVLQQVREGTYDLDANMALLKLYQFYPNSIRHEVRFFFRIFTDFYSRSSCTFFWKEWWCFLSQILSCTKRFFRTSTTTIWTRASGDLWVCFKRFSSSDKSALEIHKLLEQCNYAKFWEALQTEHDMIAEFAGFEDAIRNHICGVITHSFQRLRYETV